MTITDEFVRVPLAQIIIKRDERQRREISTAGLVDSIRQRGVLHPVIIDRQFVLHAGERRVTACRELGHESIIARFIDDLSPIEAKIVELEENVKRADLCWQDSVRGVLEIHHLYLELDEDWTQAETALAIGFKQGTVSMYLTVGPQLVEDKVVGCVTVREAYNLLMRRDQRAEADGLQEILDTSLEVEDELETRQATADEARVNGGATNGTTLVALAGAAGSVTFQAAGGTPPRRLIIDPADSILLESFLHWAPKYQGKKFNLIHCDFPYGINVFAGPQAGGRHVEATYGDSKDVYFALLQCLCENLNRLMSVSGHLMFWFSMRHHQQTLATFAELAPSLQFNPHPLIWVKSDNSGIASDASRTPRHTYETCLLASRGGRNIVKIAADAYSAPTDRTLHPSTKPIPMLRHFMGMLVDENTSLLDPTCGSAAALQAAEALNAKSVLGMDIDEQYVGIARVALRNSRTLRIASREI